MSKSRKPVTHYTASCLIGGSKVRVFALVDRNNNSVHLHVYAGDSPGRRAPIQVSRVNEAFPQDQDAALVKRILENDLVNESVEIKSLRRFRGEFKAPVGQVPMRMIFRFR